MSQAAPRYEWHPPAPLLLTREQAAELCQVSLDIVDQWSYEPGFPVIRRNGGHFVRIHRAALEGWLERVATSTNGPIGIDGPATIDGPIDGPAQLRAKKNLLEGRF